MANPQLSRNRRPVVLYGSPTQHPAPRVIRACPDDEAILGHLVRPVVLVGRRLNAATTQIPIPVQTAQLNDDSAVLEQRPQQARVTRAWAPLPAPTVSPAARQSQDLAAVVWSAQMSVPGRTVTPPHVARPYTTVALRPEPPPPPDPVNVRLSGPRRLPGVAGGRAVSLMAARADVVHTDVPPVVLRATPVRRPSRPRPQICGYAQGLIFEDALPRVKRGVRARPVPRGSPPRQGVLDGPVPTPPSVVLVRQSVRPFVPRPRIPLGRPQEQSVQTDAAPQHLNVPHARRPSRPRAQVSTNLYQNPPASDVPPGVTTPRGGPKIPPRTPSVVLRHPDTLICCEFTPGRLYRTWGVHAVIPAAGSAGRLLYLSFWDTTAQALWSIDSTAQALLSWDTTSQDLDSNG